MKKKYTAAVIGCGKIGFIKEYGPKKNKPVTHTGAFLNNRRTKLVGLMDTNAKNRAYASRKVRVPVFDSVKALMKETLPSIVVIATPDETHLEIIKQVIKQKPKLIICEKPIAPTLQQAKQIVKICKTNNVKLLINHMRRFDPVLRRTQKDIKKGKFGRIRLARCLYVNGLLNNGTHTIDLLRWFMGEIKWVQGWERKGLEATHTSDSNVDVIIEFKNGARATLQALQRDDYFIFEQEFYGSEKALKIQNVGFTVTELSIRKKSKYVEMKELDTDVVRKRGKEGRSFFATIVNHAVACLEGKEKPLATGEDAIHALEVLLAIKKSVKEDRKIKL